MMTKKTIIGGILIVSIVAIAAIAFAGYGGNMWGYPGNMMGSGYGHGYMMGPGYGHGYMMGPGYGHGYMMGPGYTGGHMMGWGNGYGPYVNDNGYGDLSAKQRAALDDAQQKFYDETQALRSKIDQKQFDLNNEIVKDNPNKDTVVNLQKEISRLQSEFDQKAVTHELAIRKLLPQGDQGPQYGAWAGARGGYCW